MAKRKINGKMGTITFRPDADVREMLDIAVKYLGETTTTLVNESLRTSLPTVINAHVNLKTEALDQLRKHFLPALVAQIHDKPPNRKP